MKKKITGGYFKKDKDGAVKYVHRSDSKFIITGSKTKLNKYYMNETLHIDIVPIDKTRFNLWDKLKTKLWNFILPPHIRLSIKKLNK